MGVNSCGTTMLDQGDFVGLASVNWDTTPKTANFTAVSGNGYFVNTTSTAITLTLPAGSVGDIIAVSDYASTSETNAITISPNGTDKINGTNDDSIIRTNGICFTLIYVDSTQGWKSIESNSVNPTGGTFITATGGTITTDGSFKVHTFTGPGTFTVCEVGNNPSCNVVDYLVIAGGGGGKHGAGCEAGGGGGAGGYRESSGCSTCFSASPSGSGVTALPITATGYPITVGGGGDIGVNGSNSIFSTITSAGGGHATIPCVNNCAGNPGGSGGGARAGSQPRVGGTGNTPPVTPPQGNDGGNAVHESGGSGGGGAGAVGYSTNTCTRFPGIPSPNSAGPGGNGGCGQTSSITGSPVGRAGGGGGASKNSPAPSVGFGKDGGGDGGGPSACVSSTAGTANTGGGGGGGNPSGTPPATVGNGSAGGSGIVIIRYRYQ